MRKLRAKTAFSLLLVGLAACAGGSGTAVTSRDIPAAASTRPASALEIIPTADRSTLGNSFAPAEVIIAINAGGSVSLGGWVADTDYQGGQVSTVSNTIDVSHVTNPAPQEVYQSQRWGSNLVYSVSNLSPNGAYNVRMDFVESFWNAPGDRIMNVNINGAPVLRSFDIFQTAGGANIATSRIFGVSADSAGKITVQLSATRNYATLAAISVIARSSAPTPTPNPTPTPSHGDVMPWVYSELWSPSSPFKTTVAQQKSSGATVVPHTYMDALWSQGIAGNGTAVGIPIYVAKASDPLLTTICTMYGGNCNAKNIQIHVPSYAVPQQAFDAHISVIDPGAPQGPIEIDCWQGTLSGSTLRCSWAGLYPLGSNGLPSGGEGIHGGMAVSTVFTTGQEIVNGHIDHVLGLDTRCLNNQSVYPTGSPTDASCDGSLNPPHYGNLLHLLWSPGQIASSPYSAPCKVVLTALATYGAFLDDTGDNGLQINTQNELSYTTDPANRSLDPWPGIQSALNAAGDGNNSAWSSCLNRLHSSDFELLQIAQH